MKKIFLLFFVVLSILSSPSYAKRWAKLDIFACTPEWGSLAQEIAGDRANIFIATTARQDPHYIAVKSSVVNEVLRADLIFCTGAAMESSWLPAILEKANEPSIQPGEIGNLAAADYVARLEIPKDNVDVNRGDTHPDGNPHIHLNPHNISLVAKEFLNRVTLLDEENANYYQARYDDFMLRWNHAIIVWEEHAARLENVPVIIAHNNWAYLIDWLGLRVIAKLEEKPGNMPSRKYMLNVLNLVRANRADFIIFASFDNTRIINWTRVRTRTMPLNLPYTVGGNPRVKNLFDLYNETLKLLLIEPKRPRRTNLVTS
jgi:zinc/manganese transport system substrate-binding protein